MNVRNSLWNIEKKEGCEETMKLPKGEREKEEERLGGYFVQKKKIEERRLKKFAQPRVRVISLRRILLEIFLI